MWRADKSPGLFDCGTFLPWGFLILPPLESKLLIIFFISFLATVKAQRILCVAAAPGGDSWGSIQAQKATKGPPLRCVLYGGLFSPASKDKRTGGSQGQQLSQLSRVLCVC